MSNIETWRIRIRINSQKPDEITVTWQEEYLDRTPGECPWHEIPLENLPPHLALGSEGFVVTRDNGLEGLFLTLQENEKNTGNNPFGDGVITNLPYLSVIPDPYRDSCDDDGDHGGWRLPPLIEPTYTGSTEHSWQFDILLSSQDGPARFHSDFILDPRMIVEPT